MVIEKKAGNGISAVGCENGDLLVFDPRIEDRYNSSGWSKLVTTTKSPRTTVCPKPDKNNKNNHIVVTGNTDGIIEHFHLTSGQQVGYSIQEDNEIYSIGYGQMGECFAVCGKKPHISLYNSQRQEIISKMGGSLDTRELNGHSNRVYAVEFYRDGSDNIVLSGGWDQTIQIWDTRAKSAIRRIIGVDICGNSILAYDGKIVSGSWRRSKQLQVFDLGSGRLQAEYTTGVTEIYALSNASDWFNEDIIAVGGSNSREILLIDINNGQNYSRLGPIEGIVTSLTLYKLDRQDDDSKLQSRATYANNDQLKITALSGQNLVMQAIQ